MSDARYDRYAARSQRCGLVPLVCHTGSGRTVAGDCLIRSLAPSPLSSKIRADNLQVFVLPSFRAFDSTIWMSVVQARALPSHGGCSVAQTGITHDDGQPGPGGADLNFLKPRSRSPSEVSFLAQHGGIRRSVLAEDSIAPERSQYPTRTGGRTPTCMMCRFIQARVGSPRVTYSRACGGRLGRATSRPVTGEPHCLRSLCTTNTRVSICFFSSGIAILKQVRLSMPACLPN